jgi:hypothetical protein
VTSIAVGNTFKLRGAESFSIRATDYPSTPVESSRQNLPRAMLKSFVSNPRGRRLSWPSTDLAETCEEAVNNFTRVLNNCADLRKFEGGAATLRGSRMGTNEEENRGRGRDFYGADEDFIELY